jgi:hypothetical protein
MIEEAEIKESRFPAPAADSKLAGWLRGVG